MEAFSDAARPRNAPTLDGSSAARGDLSNMDGVCRLDAERHEFRAEINGKRYLLWLTADSNDTAHERAETLSTWLSERTRDGLFQQLGRVGFGGVDCQAGFCLILDESEAALQARVSAYRARHEAIAELAPDVSPQPPAPAPTPQPRRYEFEVRDRRGIETDAGERSPGDRVMLTPAEAREWHYRIRPVGTDAEALHGRIWQELSG